jgi:predicted nucleic acid-binding protein
MSGRSFFDTNVLVYTDDLDAPAKQERALEVLEQARLDGRGVLSTQVLQEYFVAATRKLGVTPEIARRKVELFGRMDLVIVDAQDILAAIDLHRLHAIGFWDALVVRAARAGGCSVLYTEDLQDGWRIDGLEVVNPFRDLG